LHRPSNALRTTPERPESHRLHAEGREQSARAPIAPIKNAASFARRRDAVSKLFPGELLIVSNGHLKVRANDEF